MLRLSWGLIAVGDMTHLEVDAQPSRHPHFQDDVELLVDSLQPTTGGRYELAVSVRRDLNLPEPQEILFQEHELDLLDATGQPLRKLGQTNTLADHGATFKATFITENENAPPKKLLHLSQATQPTRPGSRVSQRAAAGGKARVAGWRV